MMYMTDNGLDRIKPGYKAVVRAIRCTGTMKRRLIDMGITPGVLIKVIKTAPLGDPIVLSLRGYELSIRRSEAEKILVTVE